MLGRKGKTKGGKVERTEEIVPAYTFRRKEVRGSATREYGGTWSQDR